LTCQAKYNLIISTIKKQLKTGMKFLERFLKIISSAEQILIVLHNYPDPDAMACASGIKFLVEQSTGIRVYTTPEAIFNKLNEKFLKTLSIN